MTRRVHTLFGVLVLAAACGTGKATVSAPSPMPPSQALPSTGYLGELVGGDVWFWRVRQTGAGLSGVLYTSTESAPACQGSYFTRQYDVTSSGTLGHLVLHLATGTGEKHALSGRLVAGQLEVSQNGYTATFEPSTYAKYLATDQAMVDRHITPKCH